MTDPNKMYFSKISDPEEFPSDMGTFYLKIKWWERMLLFFVKGHWLKDEDTGQGLLFKEMFGKKYCLKQNLFPND